MEISICCCEATVGQEHKLHGFALTKASERPFNNVEELVHVSAQWSIIIP